MRIISRVLLFLQAALLVRAEQETPITRVVKLLQGLSMKTEMEGKIEEDLYEKFVCWAKTIIGTKTATNAAARSQIDELETYIADIEAGRIEFTSERTDLEKEIKELNGDIESAKSLREEENKQFLDAKEEMTQAIAALDKAIEVLDEATKDAKEGTFLQRPQRVGVGFAALQKDAAAFQRAIELGSRTLSTGDALFLRRLLSGDVPKPDWKKLNRKATFKKKYKARSFKIQSVLQDMAKTFKQGLKDAEKKEADAKAEYEKLMKSKGKQLDEAEEALEKMEKETGARQMNKEEAKTELSELKSQVKADEGFIKQTEDVLAEKKKEWKIRKTLRTAEVAAFSKAIEILNNDDARDLRKRSFESQGYMFLQEGSTAVSSLKRINSAASVLREAAHSGTDMRLGVLAARLAASSSGHFDDVIVAIDKMIKTLKDEEAEDLKNKEACEADRAEDTRAAIKLSREMDDATDTITRLNGEIEDLNAKKAEAETTSKKTKEELTDATKQREAEKKEYKVALSDDEEMAKVVGKAKAVLQDFYKENDLMFVQRQPEVAEAINAGKAPPPPPSTWDKPYGGKTGVSMGVITSLEIIEDDIAKDIATAKASEEASVKEYIEFKEESLALIKKLGVAITEMDTAVSDKKEDVADNTKTRLSKKGSLEASMKTIADANPGCEYLTIAYPTKLKNRQIEIDGLRKAKGILQGAKFDETDENRELKPGDALFLQTK